MLGKEDNAGDVVRCGALTIPSSRQLTKGAFSFPKLPAFYFGALNPMGICSLLRAGAIPLEPARSNEFLFMIPDEAMITQYQVLVKKRFNREISREDALENGAKLLRLVELTYKPMTEAEYQKLQERRRETGDL